jgi:uncharacterized protein (UPF0248 family)
LKSENPKNRPSFAKEALERDVLNRIRWDKSLKASDYSLTYVDRFHPEEKEIPVSEISIEGDFIKHRESLIPMHRIRKILWKNKIVWNKRKI